MSAMRTDDLADMLARGAATEALPRPARIWTVATAAGTAGTVLVLMLALGPQADLADKLGLLAWWSKAGFALAVAAPALLGLARLARPGAAVGWLPVVLATPVLAMWLAAAIQLAGAPAEERLALVLGQTWAECPFWVTTLSLPLLAAALAALRLLAPTRLALAGAGAGLFAGATGALAYTLHCPELAPAFVAVWYVLGIAIPTGLGAVAGPWVLRW
jgi:hypothetical protein